jgi:AsmA protein
MNLMPKWLLYGVAAVVALLIVGVVGFMLLFDPNDFRDKIAAETQRLTGRELRIEGDLELSLFPWLAISVGKTSLSNAPGYGDEPFASFEKARLSVRLMPMLLRREVSVGAAELDSLRLNLAVAANGRSNWQDLIDRSEAVDEAAAAPDDSAAMPALDISSIAISDAAIVYRDAQTGETYSLTEVNMSSGRVAAGEPVPLSGGLTFALQPAAISGSVEVETVATFDAEAGTISLADLSLDGLVEGVAEVPTTLQFATSSFVADTKREVVSLGEVEVSVLGVGMSAAVEPFSYAGSPEPVAIVQIEAFSPRNLMQRLNIEAPPTADPDALGRMSLGARVKVGAAAIEMTDVRIVLDETTVTGALTLPSSDAGTYRFDFVADTIDLGRYMAPADESAAADETAAPVEIPVDLIRSINASGSLKVTDAHLGAMRFENVDLGLNNINGSLRIHPIAATLFEGSYSGDVRIDASGATPVLSVNEQIDGVNLGALALAMFEQESVTGLIKGAFKLSGKGEELSAIQRSLSGSMSLELVDGAFEGTDVWYEIRRALAMIKQQTPPEPVLPARTRFSNIKASGPVTDGVFRNDDLLAELPFMQVTGKGSVDIAAATLDYRMSARVLNKPELMQDVSQGELSELTKAVIPVRISGSLAAPSVKPDVEALLKQRVQQEIEDQIFDKLLGGSDKQQADDGGQESDTKKDTEDKLKDSLKDLFKR